MKKIFLRGGLALLLLLIPVLAAAATWNIDPDHSNVQFKVRHLTIADVKGTFEKFQGVVQYDEQDISKATVQVTIDVASINTGVAKRDEHLRSPDFFDVAKYPTMTFVSKKVNRVGPDKVHVSGDLTLHGVTREVVLEVTGPTKEVKDPWGNVRRGAAATTTLDRRDFGLTWDKKLETGEVMVGYEVTIALELEMIKDVTKKGS